MCAWDPGRFFKENAYVRSWTFSACLRLEQIRRLVDFMLKSRYTVKAPWAAGLMLMSGKWGCCLLLSAPCYNKSNVL